MDCWTVGVSNSRMYRPCLQWRGGADRQIHRLELELVLTSWSQRTFFYSVGALPSSPWAAASRSACHDKLAVRRTDGILPTIYGRGGTHPCLAHAVNINPDEPQLPGSAKSERRTDAIERVEQPDLACIEFAKVVFERRAQYHISTAVRTRSTLGSKNAWQDKWFRTYRPARRRRPCARRRSCYRRPRTDRVASMV